jgi:release factor glutamine methyltransferase
LTPAPAAIRAVAARLAAAGIEEPRREARIILAAAHGTDAAGLLARDELDEALYEPLVTRRALREPLAYILGHKEFWGLNFAVSPATLIPRPDSETLIEAALMLPAPTRVLDLGTGTGCLLLALLHERPEAFGVGVDISPQAAALAAQNATNLGFVNRAVFLAGHWADALQGQFDLILSNPPYIPEAEIPGLMPEVAGFEPGSALAGGLDGFTAYRHIIAELPRILAKNGTAILEIGVGQSPYLSGLAKQAGFACVARQDLGGIERAAILTHHK